MGERQPQVPYSPLTGQLLSLPGPLQPLGYSTPQTSPTRNLASVITPNPHHPVGHKPTLNSSIVHSLEWDHFGEDLEAEFGRRERLAGVISGIESLVKEEEAGIFRDKERRLINLQVSLVDVSVGQSIEEPGAENPETEVTNMSVQEDTNELNARLGELMDCIDDFSVDDVVTSRIPHVERDLKEIWNMVTQFRNQVRSFQKKHKDSLSSSDNLNLENQVKQTIMTAKNHAIQIREKSQQLEPPKTMTEFERLSLEQQKNVLEMQELSLKEQRAFNLKLESDKKTEGLAKTKASGKIVSEWCAQIGLDVQRDDDSWQDATDDDIRKAMRSKEDWMKRLAKIKEEYIQYETLVSTWSPTLLVDSEGEYCQIRSQYELVIRAVEAVVDTVEGQDNARGLYSLDVNSGAKLEYPKFSGKFSEDFVKFQDKMERAFKANRVPKVDQVDKLREMLSGFALSLVPDNMRSIDAAFQALKQQWGDPERVLESRLVELRKLGPLPVKDSNGQPNYQKEVQWYLTLDGILHDIIEIGGRSDDLADEAFKQSTIREILNMFPDRIHLKLTSLPGRRKQKLTNIRDYLTTYRTNAQTLDKERRVEGEGKHGGGGGGGRGAGGGGRGAGGYGAVTPGAVTPGAGSDDSGPNQTAHSTTKIVETCRICKVLESQGKTGLYENHLSSWPIGCPKLIEMKAEDRFQVISDARICRACMNPEVIFSYQHINECVPRQKAKTSEKSSFSCTYGRCPNHRWLCTLHKIQNAEAMKVDKANIHKKGLVLAHCSKAGQANEASKGQKKKGAALTDTPSLISPTGKQEAVTPSDASPNTSAGGGGR